MPDAAHHEDAKRERYSKMLYIKAVKKNKERCQWSRNRSPAQPKHDMITARTERRQQ